MAESRGDRTGFPDPNRGDRTGFPDPNRGDRTGFPDPNRGDRTGFPDPESPYGLCGRKATFNEQLCVGP